MDSSCNLTKQLSVGSHFEKKWTAYAANKGLNHFTDIIVQLELGQSQKTLHADLFSQLRINKLIVKDI